MDKARGKKKAAGKKEGKRAEALKVRAQEKKTADAKAVVRTFNLTKNFGKIKALKGLSMSVPEKCIYGLVGPNGAGKTTTLGILATFIHPTSGNAEIMGYDPAKSPEEVKKMISILPQDALFYPDRTASDILTFYARLSGLKDPEAEAEKVLDRVGLNENKHKKMKEMSHGMVKLVGIAQALLGSPKIIMLDEATSGLDPRMAYNIRNLVRELKKESTVIFSSHNLYEVQDMCDYVGIVHDGRIILEGRTRSIIKKKHSLEKVFMEKISGKKA